MRIGVVGLITIGGASSGTAGGVEKLIEEVTVRQAAHGHRVTVYCRGRYNRDGLTEYQGVRLVNLPAIYTKHLEAITHSFLSMLWAIAQNDVIQFHSMGPALLSFFPRLFGRKTVCTLHGLDYRRDKWGALAKFVLRVGEHCALRFPNATTVVSRFMEKHYREEAGRKVTYIPNGVPIVAERSLDKLKRFGLEPNKYILYLSRIVPEKGCHYLVEAFRKVDTDMKLAIVGDSRHAAEYLDRVKKIAGDDPRIVFTGALYGEEKEEAYSNAYVFCLPSDLEGLPIVLLEAMGNGRCCLVSDIPEMVEVVDPRRLGYAPSSADAPEGPYGYTFKQGNVDDLAAQLQITIASPRDVEAMRSTARAYVQVEYSWDHIAAAYENVYASVVNAQ